MSGRIIPFPGQFRKRYMMATQAYYSNELDSYGQPQLCFVEDEDEDCYIGRWITGLGFVGLRFPKNTTRELTAEEREHYKSLKLRNPSGIVTPMLVEEQEDI